MTAYQQAAKRPTHELLEAWSYRNDWTLEEAVPLALGISPDSLLAETELLENATTLERARRSGETFRSPKWWLWWGQRNGLPFHEDWWIAITPQGPIGFDGQHFAFSREQILSERYRAQERALIGKWARKPYWTSREAIDLSLNFDPYTTNGWRGEAPETGDTIREREDRFRILERALEMEEITEKASPLEWLNWLNTRGYYVSEAWTRAVGLKLESVEPVDDHRLTRLVEENADLNRKLNAQIAKVTELEEMQIVRNEATGTGDEEIARLRQKIKELSEDADSPSAKGAQAKRIASLQKALIAMAVDGYSYDPRRAKSDVPVQVAEKSEELGIPMTPQTVRKYLREAADIHVDQGIWEQLFPRK
ncbi:hypothetical protein AVO45_13465 [Ruegeria marisrubri]|uniref:Uncharacterized protein n=1 Tax=Ruegeria marisrubri TaxID=1685379 RepID=A0A0X3TKM7_9RHOB|nr:hypothetical protein [Ruegeria marisrubri]KUJ76303.1 hypothetical protein AVO45_13465 [Ruegeria marisrubri]